MNKLGFGTWGIGGDSGPLSGYGPASDRDSVEALEKAYELGIAFYDTAPPYGNGKSEELLGQVFQNIRGDIQILTKVGVQSWLEKPDYSAKNVDKSIDNSLNRLKTNYLDYVVFHSLKELESAEVALEVQEGYSRLKKLKEMGVLKNIGFSVKNPEDIIKLIERYEEIDVLEANFNLLDTRLLSKEITSMLMKNNIFVITRTPFAFGFLTDKINSKTEFNISDHRSRWSIEQRSSWHNGKNNIKNIFRKYNYNYPIELCALKFCMSFEQFNMVIPGMMTVDEVLKNSRVLEMEEIPVECIQEIIKYNANLDSFIK
jgi:aryl-alcohol dehydrogenase-like predicted oxidoreductase